MLPITLRLRNFLCYREEVPPLHLENVRVACLCGANGHGKSALLDAMTWALWGKARGQRQEQLVHHGQQEMQVELEFDARGERYQVVRRYSRARRQGVSSLELFVFSGESYRPITGDSMAATQAFIHRLLSMDYETFVNSAFLLQGRADLFTMATPTQRKEVLAKVLGLGLYDRLEERAKAQTRQVQGRLEATATAVERLQSQVARRPELQDAHAQVEAELTAAQEALSSLEARLDLLRKQVVQLERRQEEQRALEEGVEREKARRQEAAQEAAELERRLTGWQETLGRAEQIEAGFQALTIAQERLQKLHAASQRVHALERELHPYEQRIAAARASLESDIGAQERYVRDDLAARVDGLPALEVSLQQAVEALAGIGAQVQELSRLGERQQELALEAQRLQERNERLELDGKETRAKLDMLDHAHQEGVRCPLCGTELGAEARARLEAAYQQEIASQRQQFREHTAQLKALEQEAGRFRVEAAQSQEKVDAERGRLEDQRVRLQQQRDEALRAQRQLGEAQAVLAEARKALEDGRYAQEEQSQAEALRRQIAALQYSQEAHQKAEPLVQELGTWEGEHRRLLEARSRLAEDEAALTRARARLEEAKKELERLEEAQGRIAQELTQLTGYRAQLREVEGEHRAAAERRDALQERRGSLSHQLEEVARAQRELQELERERGGLAREVGLYQELSQAFGKSGVQALLIEAATPRLEDEANALLGRMTNGRMSLKLETQRPRRTASAARAHGQDEPIETLDILIADELGTRSYEMFSGGESFRIDFALRIALSKLLAWRAGAPLPTLFIDEGFGTQDAEGRDRVLDVIKSIEPDFQRILVITHMEEVREAFPVRIEVTRTAAGSTFSIV